MTPRLSFQDFERFEPLELNVHLNNWQDDEIWAIINTYPKPLREEFENLKRACHHYFSQNLREFQGVNYVNFVKFLKRFTFHLCQSEDVERSFVNSSYVENQFEFDWYMYKLQKFWSEEPVPYKSNFPYYSRLRYLHRRGYFRKWNIRKFDEVLETMLKDKFDIKKFHLSFKGELGLERAKNYCQEYFNEINKIPLRSDKRSTVFNIALVKGYWKDQNVVKWGDLLWESLGSKPDSLSPYLNSRGGFEYAKSKIRVYYNEKKSIPGVKEHSSFFRAVSTGQWKKYGVENWDDLLYAACKKRRKANKWEGKTGLNKAIDILKAYHEKTGKLPAANRFSTIYSQCVRPRWKEYDINSWNDLNQHIFGRVNHGYH